MVIVDHQERLVKRKGEVAPKEKTHPKFEVLYFFLEVCVKELANVGGIK